MEFVNFLKNAPISTLFLPRVIEDKLQHSGIYTLADLYPKIQAANLLNKNTIAGLTPEEFDKVSTSIKSSVEAFRLQESGKTDLSNAGVRQAKAEIKTHLIDGNQSQLVYYEKNYRKLVSKATLIGEVYLSEDDLVDIAHHMRIWFDNSPSMTKALESLEVNFPATFACFMVSIGLYYYGKHGPGDYWSGFFEVLSKDNSKYQPNQNLVGPHFEGSLKRLGKSLFEDIRSNQRYVYVILLHAGIPIYCLRDYFDKILWPSVSKETWSMLNEEDLINEVNESNTIKSTVDKPILRFLDYGGQVSLGFLYRSRELAREWANGSGIKTAQDAGLPQSLIDEFTKWTQTKNKAEVQSEGQRLKRPIIQLDPWGYGLLLRLPAEPISLGTQEVLWAIKDSVNTANYQPITATLQQKAGRIYTREEIYVLSHPSDQLSISLLLDDSKREFDLSFLPLDKAIFFFNPDNGAMQSFPVVGTNWLLIRPQAVVTFHGSAHMVEELPPLPGIFSEFRSEVWEIAADSSIQIGNNKTIYPRSATALTHPHLSDLGLSNVHQSEQNWPIYAPHLPSIIFPSVGSDENFWSLGWEINIAAIDGENRTEVINSNLLDLSGSLSNYGNSQYLDLSKIEKLLVAGYGGYSIKIKGGLGRDANLNFWWLPELTVVGADKTLYPDDVAGSASYPVVVYSAVDGQMQPADINNQVKVQSNKPGTFRVNIPNELNRANLQLILNDNFIPFTIRLKKLRWRLFDRGVIQEQWNTEPLNIFLVDLLQEESTYLLVELPFGDAPQPSLQLRMMIAPETPLLEVAPDTKPTRNHQHWRFDLRKLQSQLMAKKASNFGLELLIRFENQDEKTVLLGVIKQNLVVDNLNPEISISGNKVYIETSWNERNHLLSKSFAIWSLFRPWQPPFIEEIPDSQVGSYSFEMGIEEQGIGLFAIHMFVSDPWLGTEIPKTPPAEAISFWVGSGQEALNDAENRYLKTNSIATLVERYLIRKQLGLKINDGSLGKAIDSCEKMSFEQLLIFSELVRENGESDWVTYFGKKLAMPSALKLILQEIREYKVSLESAKRIFSFLPDSSTWGKETSQVLLTHPLPYIQKQAIERLVELDISFAITYMIEKLRKQQLSFTDCVGLLLPFRDDSLKILRDLPPDPIAEQLERLVLAQKLPIRSGSWVQTNAGWSVITSIMDLNTKEIVSEFMEGSEHYRLSVEFAAEHPTVPKATIDLKTKTIHFSNGSKIYACQYCNRFASPDYKSDFTAHMISNHANKIPQPPISGKVLPLDVLVFNNIPQ